MNCLRERGRVGGIAFKSRRTGKKEENQTARKKICDQNALPCGRSLGRKGKGPERKKGVFAKLLSRHHEAEGTG